MTVRLTVDELIEILAHPVAGHAIALESGHRHGAFDVCQELRRPRAEKSVRNGPYWMALTRTVGASARAIASVRALRPAFAAAYGIVRARRAGSRPRS
jgi:hypothetical protein